MDELCIAKKNLFDCLGTNFKSYLSLLRSWFRSNLTKDEFDCEARKLFNESTVKKHNAFLLALFNRCQDISTLDGHKDRKPRIDVKNENDKSNKKVKLKKGQVNLKISYDKRFVPANPLHYTPVVKKSRKNDLEKQDTLLKVAFSASEGSLPDHFMANLRMLVIVWESGLDNLSNDSVLMLNLALRDFIKNIFMSVLTFKSSYRSFDKGQLRYAVGAPAVNPYLKNALNFCKFPQNANIPIICKSSEHLPYILPSNEAAEHEAIYQIACSKLPKNCYDDAASNGQESNIITLWQLFHALRLNKATIPSHSVYTINMEKIITRLSHKCDSREDLYEY